MFTENHAVENHADTVHSTSVSVFIRSLIMLNERALFSRYPPSPVAHTRSFPSLGGSKRLEGRDLMETSLSGLSVLKSLTPCIMSSYGFL